MNLKTAQVTSFSKSKKQGLFDSNFTSPGPGRYNHNKISSTSSVK